VCGNGIQEGSEECDLGEENGQSQIFGDCATITCNNDCTLPYCGDGNWNACGSAGFSEQCGDGGAPECRESKVCEECRCVDPPLSCDLCTEEVKESCAEGSVCTVSKPTVAGGVEVRCLSVTPPGFLPKSSGYTLCYDGPCDLCTGGCSGTGSCYVKEDDTGWATSCNPPPEGEEGWQTCFGGGGDDSGDTGFDGGDLGDFGFDGGDFGNLGDLSTVTPPTVNPPTTTPRQVCGDNIVQTGEECDQGGFCDGGSLVGLEIFSASDAVACREAGGRPLPASGDGCSERCKLEICGDGIVQVLGADGQQGTEDDEQCDPGPIPSLDCIDCRFVQCGDGVQQGSEECDDGNDNIFDSCTPDCRFPVCGNRVVEGIEECDDGNNLDGDGCFSNCALMIPPERFEWETSQ